MINSSCSTIVVKFPVIAIVVMKEPKYSILRGVHVLKNEI